ncbi:MAG: hypothetical protein LBQ67_03665 [Treponema sp.]|jgi:hypothetical protein|nr:hypothetical protein [Treponema sp.]
MNFLKSAISAVLSAFLVLSCAGGGAVYGEIDPAMEAAAFSQPFISPAQGGSKKPVYTNREAVLFHLDQGMIGHYAGFWEESSRDLETGERLIEDAFTKSLSQAIASYIVNDTVKDYPGEDYEDLYINVFNSLNYYHRGDLEGALVEIRRLNEKLLYLSDKYETAKSKVLDSRSELSSTAYAREASSFSNSALARYLGVLFYRGNGSADDARIDMEELKAAYELAPEVYANPLPSSLEDELAISRGLGRLNVIAFTGLSPIKSEENIVIPLPYPAPNNFARVALPKMIDRPSMVRAVEIVLDGGESFELEVIENMSAVARETFKSRHSLVVLKSVARAIIKATTSAGLAGAAEDRVEGLGALIGLLGKVASEATEKADTRTSWYFPACAFVGGINLEPGIYSVTINYYGADGLIGTDRRENLLVRENNLNLTEFICLK